MVDECVCYDIINMTLNVPVSNQGVPLAIPMEQFILYRKDIEFEVRIDNLGKKELKGTVIHPPFRPFSLLIASSSSALPPPPISTLSMSPLPLSTKRMSNFPSSGTHI